MKIKDYEKTAEALNCGIKIDEFKLRKGQVVLALAHNEHTLLLWDENGRAFAIPYEPPYFCTEDFHERHTYDDYDRDTNFDLKFD